MSVGEICNREVIVVTEVVLGYVTLGMLLAILANRVARRA